ncbi:flagellar protein FlaG [Amphritea sp.]|uniref:flagellar protein FlaG n=1 Tax=Amphritea sp. TaxID=1872502 RepID=UPI0035618542
MAAEIQIPPSPPSRNSTTTAQNNEPIPHDAKEIKALPQEQTVIKVEATSSAELSEQNTEALKQTVAAINDFMAQFQRTLNFSVDQDRGQTIIKVIDTSSDELVRQIPSEDFLKISKHIEQMNNLLFSEKA